MLVIKNVIVVKLFKNRTDIRNAITKIANGTNMFLDLPIMSCMYRGISTISHNANNAVTYLGKRGYCGKYCGVFKSAIAVKSSKQYGKIYFFSGDEIFDLPIVITQVMLAMAIIKV